MRSPATPSRIGARPISMQTAMAEEIELNRRFLEGLDSSIRLENFAYPYGSVSVSRKNQLAGMFRSARSILPGVNSGSIDLQFLRATPLVEPAYRR